MTFSIKAERPMDECQVPNRCPYCLDHVPHSRRSNERRTPLAVASWGICRLTVQFRHGASQGWHQGCPSRPRIEPHAFRTSCPEEKAKLGTLSASESRMCVWASRGVRGRSLPAGNRLDAQTARRFPWNYMAIQVLGPIEGKTSADLSGGLLEMGHWLVFMAASPTSIGEESSSFPGCPCQA